jgi:hypothetical protein
VPLEFTPLPSQITFLALLTATPVGGASADCRAPLDQEVDIFVGDKTGALAWWRFVAGEQPQHVANLTRDATKAGHVQSLFYHRARQVFEGFAFYCGSTIFAVDFLRRSRWRARSVCGRTG